ncbi:hypothetical protein AG1IA_09232 [Rhizoctonia solani AG-1 IA]|uniref:Uncharacterized protein n=1 Tax=Thanatephorus cucumeris (strain AG1-IA) TaxID=983506 RepID=L8WIV2_THACA|nr:hypothetical protein AG1IA_09232 [Rhizoctonia solani AG-1 IA]
MGFSDANLCGAVSSSVSHNCLSKVYERKGLGRWLQPIKGKKNFHGGDYFLFVVESRDVINCPVVHPNLIQRSTDGAIWLTSLDMNLTGAVSTQLQHSYSQLPPLPV